jgi:hypothetical protein
LKIAVHQTIAVYRDGKMGKTERIVRYARFSLLVTFSDAESVNQSSKGCWLLPAAG